MTHEWACAVWMHDTDFDVVCFQSVNGYAYDLLTQAAKTRQEPKSSPNICDLFTARPVMRKPYLLIWHSGV
jgi:hypothetical protein